MNTFVVDKSHDLADAPAATPDGAVWVRDAATGAWVPRIDWASDADVAAAMDARSILDFDKNWQFPLPPMLMTANPQAITANDMHMNRMMIGKSGNIVDITLGVSGSSGNVDVGIWTFDGTTYTLLWSTGSIPCPPASVATSLGNPALPVQPGNIVGLSLACNNGVASFPHLLGAFSGMAKAAPGVPWPRTCWRRAASFPLPATVLDSSVVDSFKFHAIGVKIV